MVEAEAWREGQCLGSGDQEIILTLNGNIQYIKQAMTNDS